MEGKATGSEVKIFCPRYSSTRYICMWRQNTTTNPTQIPTQLVTCGPPRVISLIKDNMLLSSVSFLYFFLNRILIFLFLIFWEEGFEELASSPRAQAPQLQVHSNVFCVLARAGLYLALALWGKEKRECVSGWEVWARKCLLFCKRESIQHLLAREETVRPLLRGAQGKFHVKNGNSQLYAIFDFQWVLISNCLPQKCCTNLLSF